MSVSLKLHRTTRYVPLPGEQPVTRTFWLVDGARDFIDALSTEYKGVFGEPLPNGSWINDSEAESSQKTHDAYGHVLTWTTAGKISRIANIEDEWRHPKDIATMEFLRTFGPDDPDRIMILELT